MTDESGESDGAWYTFAFGPPDAPLAGGLRFVERDGRLVASDLYLHGDRLTPQDLRRFPLTRWEAAVNMDQGALHRHRQRLGGDPDPRISELRGLLELLSARALKEERLPTGDRPTLGRPPAGGDPDVFYREVATAYREYAVQTKAAAASIAEEAGVPVTTAHRWVREARRRGFLPPGQKGKVG